MCNEVRKNVLIVADIPDWATDVMSNGIILSLSKEFNFTKIYGEIDDLSNFNYDKFDIVYVMLPGYLPKINDYSKFRTTFHGGPGTEGQVDELKAYSIDIKTSYVSNQVNERIKKKEYVSQYYTPCGVNFKKFSFKPDEDDELICGYAGWAS